MANQLKMADVQAILTLHQRGWSARRIALELGIHRETVGQYLKQAQAERSSKPASAPLGSEGALDPVTDGSKPASAPPGSEGVLGGATKANPDPQAGAPAPSGSEGVADPKPASAPPGSDGWLEGGAEPGSDAPAGVPAPDGLPQTSTSAAWPWREVIVQKLNQGLAAQRIYQDLSSPEHGYQGSYYSVRRLVTKLTGGRERPVRRMECPAAAEAQVDFGKGAAIAGADGKRKTSWVFRIVLSHSRKGYSEAVLRQGTDEFLRCLENSFAHFGGLAKTLVIDNLRAAVSRPDWYDPELCPKVRSFAEHYGIAILPTKPYTPRHKGKVENGVKYVKNNCLKGLSFSSLAAENQHLLQWESAVADKRIHGTTRQQVIKLFTEVEKPALLPLPASRFELFSEALRAVHRDGHVQVKEAYYSVPPEYLGCNVWARWDGRLVRLYDHRMHPIAVHAQQVPGRFSTHQAHILPEKINGIERGATWMLGQVDRIGPHAKAWAETMLASRGIEGVRVLMGLLHLGHQHPRPQVERACQVASGHGAYHLRSLRQLIQQGQKASIQQSFEFADQHPIIRPVADYGQFVRDALTGQSFTQ
jgi:transposase